MYLFLGAMAGNTNNCLPWHSFHRANDAYRVTRVEISDIHLDAYQGDSVLRTLDASAKVYIEWR